jgi:hypothetical protein
MHGPGAKRRGQALREANEQATAERPSGRGHGVRKRQQVSQEALVNHAADVALAAKFDEWLAAARQAELEFRRAEVSSAIPLTERRRLAVNLDAALTEVMRSAFAAQRAAIGPRGYDDRIYRRKAMARPDVHALTGEAERLLTLRESHRLNGIPPAPLQPTG